MNPICCNNEMKVDKNGVLVGLSNSLTRRYSGDRFLCEVCGNKIVTNFGEGFESDRPAELVVD